MISNIAIQYFYDDQFHITFNVYSFKSIVDFELLQNTKDLDIPNKKCLSNTIDIFGI